MTEIISAYPTWRELFDAVEDPELDQWVGDFDGKSRADAVLTHIGMLVSIATSIRDDMDVPLIDAPPRDAPFRRDDPIPIEVTSDVLGLLRHGAEELARWIDAAIDLVDGRELALPPKRKDVTP